MSTRDSKFQSKIRSLTRQLNTSLRLLEHQERHLTFLEGLIGKSCQKSEETTCDNKELHEHINRLLKGEK